MSDSCLLGGFGSHLDVLYRPWLEGPAGHRPCKMMK